MATRILHTDGRQAKRKSNRNWPRTRFTLADSPPGRFIRDGLQPRIILFPPGIIAKHDREPGELCSLVTLAVSQYLKTGESPPPAVVAAAASTPAITWTRTHNGRAVDLLNPDPADIDIEDIASALSRICRFAGHTSEFYSVAQHSVVVSRLCPPKLRLKGLLHDAAEAFTNDMPTPVKSILSPAARAELKMIDTRLMVAIGKAFRVDLSHDAAVKRADLAALRAEAELLLPEPIAGYIDLPNDPVEEIIPWRPDVAEKNFLDEFRRLMSPRLRKD